MRRPVSRGTTLVRWTLSTLAFVGIGLIDVGYGHGPALATLLVLLLAVFFLSGSGGAAGGGAEDGGGTNGDGGSAPAGEGAGPEPDA
ncbi:MAG: hypothetical protein KDH92_06095 [Chloroflexi bacterium]|nr:hypothetical protein [Chloroflexota bacterium]